METVHSNQAAVLSAASGRLQPFSLSKLNGGFGSEAANAHSQA
jgi:hypothetical protein